MIRTVEKVPKRAYWVYTCKGNLYNQLDYESNIRQISDCDVLLDEMDDGMTDNNRD